MNTSSLIIIRGMPASGKSSIGQALRNFDKKRAWIELDSFRMFFSTDRSISHEETVDAAVTLIDHLLSNGWTVITTGAYYKTEWINTLLHVAEKYKVKSYVFTLDVSMKTSIARDETRPHVQKGVYPAMGEKLTQWYKQKFDENPLPESVHIDTEKTSIEDCIKAVAETAHLD